MLATLIEQLKSRRDLAPQTIGEAMGELTADSIAPEVKAEFLAALAEKGESIDEIAGFARELRRKALSPQLDETVRNSTILDVCGTGGDRLNTFNISTSVAIVAAAAGVFVAKHGNRAITSQSGSADVLEELGIPVDLNPAEAAASLRERHFAFFFAPKYHPAFKHIAPARKLCAERGQRTIFNFLGPLLNPALPDAQLIGVPRPELCETIAKVLQSLGTRRGMVVCGTVPRTGTAGHSSAELNLDELSSLGSTRLAEFYQDRGFHVSDFVASHLPVQPGTLDDLIGGDRRANAAIVQRVLSGDDRAQKRDAVLLNAAAALLVAGRVQSISAGWDLAAEVIDSGAAVAKLKELST